MTEASGTDQSQENIVDTQLVYAHGIAALITLLISAIFGIVVSLQFFLPDLAGDWLALGWGRLRYAHTQGIMLGWFGVIFAKLKTNSFRPYLHSVSKIRGLFEQQGYQRVAHTIAFPWHIETYRRIKE